MKIEQLKIDQLIPYQFNNRVHSDEQVNLIANSIDLFGFNQPIVIDEANIILVGHGRLEAAKKLGLKTVPTYKISGLTEAQKKAYRILDNKLQNDSEWDFENLKIELDNLEDLQFNSEDWGLDELLKLAPVEEENEVFEDGGPGELPEEPFIKIGDVIELGPHRVMCGDTTYVEHVKKLIGKESIDIILTDPPYGISMDSSWHGKNKRTIVGDGDDWNENLIKCIFTNWNSKFQIIFGSDYFIEHIPERNKGALLVWDKRSNDNQIGLLDGAIGSDFETIWVSKKIKRQIVRELKQTGAFAARGHDRSTGHPTQKPIRLFQKVLELINFHDYKFIGDPYLGSGTTLIAADQIDRICYGMEISPKSCQVILERYIKYRNDAGKDVKIKINGEDFDPKSINL
jgi:DNA modification methylase